MLNFDKEPLSLEELTIFSKKVALEIRDLKKKKKTHTILKNTLCFLQSAVYLGLIIWFFTQVYMELKYVDFESKDPFMKSILMWGLAGCIWVLTYMGTLRLIERYSDKIEKMPYLTVVVNKGSESKTIKYPLWKFSENPEVLLQECTEGMQKVVEWIDAPWGEPLKPYLKKVLSSRYLTNIEFTVLKEEAKMLERDFLEKQKAEKELENKRLKEKRLDELKSTVLKKLS